MDPILRAKARRLAARQQVEADWSTQPHLTSDKDAMTHQVSVALMKFLSEVAIRLGVAKHVYVVGGAVRNFIINMPIKDIDVVIDSVRAGQDSDWFAAQVGKAIPTVTSLVTNQYGVAILTVKGDWEVEGQNLKGEVLEIANARKESYGGTGGKGYKPHMVEPATVEEDVIRREFTFNTLMWRLLDLAKGPDKAEIIDLTGCGIRDLQEGVARCPSPPDKTFADDPTRMLRAIKFFVKYGLTVSPDVEASIKKNAPMLKNAPHEAISSLLIGTILHESTAIKGLKEMKRLGLLDVVADMVRTNKTFRATMQNWASNQKVLLLFDMMDLGLPLNVRANFLTKKQQLLLRQVSLGMEPGEPERFLATLKQPGRLVDMKYLIQETGLRGREIQKLNEAIRETLLVDPELRHSARKLTQEVLRPFQGRRASGRGPATLPLKRGRADFYAYGDDSGNWELSQFADFGAGKAGKWAMTSSLASRNDWKNLSVDNATEHHRGFRKALKEMVAKYPELIEYLIQFDGPWMPVTKLVGTGAAKPQVDLSKVTFYHGTSSAAWVLIQKNGLRPREMTKVDPAYGVAMGARPGHKDSIYLTTQSNTAMFAARDAARNTRSDMVILEMTGLDPSRFAPDEDSGKETAVGSLELMGSVAYVGSIPASKVRLYYREGVSWKQASKLAREFLKEKQLQKYLKDHPKADRRKHKVRGLSTKKTAPKGTKKNLKAKFHDFVKKFKVQMKDTGNLGKTLGALMSGKPVSEKQRAAIKRQVADVFKMLIVGTSQVSPIPGSSLVWPAVVASINRVFHKEYNWKPSAFQKVASEEAFQRIFNAILSELEEENASKSARATRQTQMLETLVKEFEKGWPRLFSWGRLVEDAAKQGEKAMKEWVPSAKKLLPLLAWAFEDKATGKAFPKRKLTNIRKFVERVSKAKEWENLVEILRKFETKSLTAWQKWVSMRELLIGMIRGYDVEIEGKFEVAGFKVRLWSDPVSNWTDKKVQQLRVILEQSAKLLKRAGAGKVLGIRVSAYAGDFLPVNTGAGTRSALAFFHISRDYMAVAVGQNVKDTVHSVVHELGHRYYYKVLGGPSRDAWRDFYDKGFGTPPDLDGLISRWEQATEKNELKKWLSYYITDIKDSEDIQWITMIRRKGFLGEEKFSQYGPKGTPALEQLKRDKSKVSVYLNPVGTGYSASSASELFAEAFSWGIVTGPGVMPEIVQDAFKRSAPNIKLARSPKVPNGTGPVQLRYKGFKILNPNRYDENVHSRLFRAIDFALGMFKKRGVGPVITNTIKQFEISRGGGSSISGIYSSSKQSIRVAAETLMGQRQGHINRIVVHEIGHHVHMWYIPPQAKREWDKGWDAINKAQEDNGPYTDVRKLQAPLGLPSDYASEDLKEDFAETWATYMLNPQGLSPMANYRFLHTLSLAGLYDKPVMRLANRYLKDHSKHKGESNE